MGTSNGLAHHKSASIHAQAIARAKQKRNRALCLLFVFFAAAIGLGVGLLSESWVTGLIAVLTLGMPINYWYNKRIDD